MCAAETIRERLLLLLSLVLRSSDDTMSSVEHRTIARLPLEIFTDLQHHYYHPRPKDSSHHPVSYGENDEDIPDEQQLSYSLTPEEIRREIAAKLKTTKTRKYRSEHHTNPNPQQQQNYKNHNSALHPPRQSQYYYESITTVGSLLRLSPLMLLRALDPLLTYGECQEFYRRVGQATAPASVTAWELLQLQQPPTVQNCSTILATGLPTLDASLRGGLRVGTLTELVGCAGVGKTQLALQMACQCPGATIFIDTEAKVSLSRLQEMAHHHRTNVLSRVTVHSSNNFVELCQVLGQMEDTILNHNSSSSSSTVPPVKLLVIDSIAAPVRRHEFGSAAAQAAAVLQLAQTVKRLADQFQLVALVINQVASSSSSSVSSSSLSIPAPQQQQQQQQSTTKAALGTAWHHCVSTRVELELRTAPGDSIVSRHATVVKSNLVGASPPLEFKITTQGLVAV